jgi:hypothetical protein
MIWKHQKHITSKQKKKILKFFKNTFKHVNKPENFYLEYIFFIIEIYSSQEIVKK